MANIKKVSFSLNQFAHAHKLIDTVPGKLERPTVSLCHVCYQHIPAYTYTLKNQLWLVKQCRLHGVSHHMIERDHKFIQNLSEGAEFLTDTTVLVEVSDRCNLDCPHCYHMPDNKVLDGPRDQIIEQIASFYQPGMDVILTGAEATLRKDFPELISELINNFKKITVSTLTNGIRFADKDFLSECLDAGLDKIRLGLNHPDYLGNEKIRQKQIQSIINLKELGRTMSYIGYTMSTVAELHDILEETTNSGWSPGTFRIRSGSDIGRYPDQKKLYVSDLFKLTRDWCRANNKKFAVVPGADNNIHHVMIKINEVPFRLIRWCDETDIDMEELRCGPWAAFVPHDGQTNFLHQIIRRDVWKNRGLPLTDLPPARYLLQNVHSREPLDFQKLSQV